MAGQHEMADGDREQRGDRQHRAREHARRNRLPSGRPSRWSTRSGAGASSASSAAASGAARADRRHRSARPPPGQRAPPGAARQPAQRRQEAERIGGRLGGEQPERVAAPRVVGLVLDHRAQLGARAAARARCPRRTAPGRTSPAQNASGRRSPTTITAWPAISRRSSDREPAQPPLYARLAQQRRTEPPQDQRVGERERRQRHVVMARRTRGVPASSAGRWKRSTSSATISAIEGRAGREQQRARARGAGRRHSAASRRSAASRSGSSAAMRRANWTSASSPYWSSSSRHLGVGAGAEVLLARQRGRVHVGLAVAAAAHEALRVEPLQDREDGRVGALGLARPRR